jgi:AmpD protein
MFANGWYQQAVRQPCDFYNARPEAEISLIVVHCISLPEGEYGTGCVEQLFAGCLDCQQHPSFNDLQGLEVSAHFFINRKGETKQFVSVNDRAWHAGQSSFNGRENCNDFSIGVELEGTDKTEFTAQQYQSLLELTLVLMKHYNIDSNNIVGHSDIAPGRKTDPGIGFDWSSFRQQLKQGEALLSVKK